MRLHPLFSQERVRVRFTSFTLKTSLRVPLAEYVSGSEISPDRTGKMPVPLQVTPPSPEGGVRTLITNPVYFIYRTQAHYENPHPHTPLTSSSVIGRWSGHLPYSVCCFTFGSLQHATCYQLFPQPSNP